RTWERPPVRSVVLAHGGGEEGSAGVYPAPGLAPASSRRFRLLAGRDRPADCVRERMVRDVRLHSAIRGRRAIPSERPRGFRGPHGLHPRVSPPTGLHRIQQCERTGQGGGSTSPDQVRSLAYPVSCVESRRERDTVLVKLSDGEDLLPSLEAAAREHDVESGTVLWGIGMLRDFEIGFFGPKGYDKSVF